MSALSFENIDRLYWLGRYSERVFTSLKSFSEKFDAMISYGSHESRAEFARQICFDKSDQSSIYSGLLKAYDNAIVLRDEIGSETFSYVQLALYEMNRAEKAAAPLLHLQKVIDNIAAFWGMADDIIEDERVRGIIKLGKRIERIDLFTRMGAPENDIRREVRRMSYRIAKVGVRYEPEKLSEIISMANDSVINRPEFINKLEALIEI